jgi:hypothetical protein
MKSEYIRAATLLTIFAVLTVPSLVFAVEGDAFCYKTDLYIDGQVVGEAKYTGEDGEYSLEVEIEGFAQQGDFEVRLFKDYYSNFVAGSLTIDENGDGKAVFNVPYQDPDFKVIIEDAEYSIVSGEWVECEAPVKPVRAKISPSVLNLKSKGKWVTVKVTYPFGDETPNDISLTINGELFEPTSVKIGAEHMVLKFSRSELKKHCEPGEYTVTVSFQLGASIVELSDAVKVINPGETQVTVGAKTAKGKSKAKSNNGKADGKNKK